MSCRDFFEKVTHLGLITEYRQPNGYTSLRIKNKTPLHLIANVTPQAASRWLGQLGFICITPPATGKRGMYILLPHSCDLNIDRYRRDILSRIVSSERFTDIIQEIQRRSQQANQNQISHQSYTFRPSQISTNQMIDPMRRQRQNQRYNPVASTNAALQHSARPRDPVATQLLTDTPLSIQQSRITAYQHGDMPGTSNFLQTVQLQPSGPIRRQPSSTSQRPTPYQQPATQESFSTLHSLLENTSSQPDPSGLNTRQRSLSPYPYERPPLSIQPPGAPRPPSRPQTPLSLQRPVSPIRPVYDNPSSEDIDDILETLRSHVRTPSPRR
ncbi:MULTISPECIES: hypothetical protein [Xenorhabdus]|uniref:Uncharacterized protein n=1 Tax=Xenorhabdus ehlersii TaxID=290111 RepID=A0A2D0IK65_9GAMM|nr:MULTISPECIES: hypothetical protein [Xenorhabdus]MBC8951039.1 hypothetical protein [Xenorhabdus sp. TS4]PHM22172.1 hypothetical protein Xehl_03883 [Xenorhabdus ehlersii]RKE87038.1 hypothetical protein BDE27_3841 [Xenorhabdus ehlersii]